MKTVDEKKAYLHQYYLEHKEVRKQASKEYYAQNKDVINQRLRETYSKRRESVLARSKQWSENNPGKVAARAATWQANNKTQRSIIRKRWWDKNPEKARIYATKRRDKRKSLGEIKHTLVGEIAKIIYTQFSNKCFRCGGTNHLCLDHHMPLSAGYALELGNAVVLCRSCNSSKGNKFPEDFYSFSELQALSFMLTEQKRYKEMV